MDNELEILISAIDDASPVLEELGASMTAMSETMEADLAEVGLAWNATTGEIENAALTQTQSFALAAEMATQSSGEIIELMAEEGISAQAAAEVIAEADAEIADANVATASSSAGAFAGMAAIGTIAFLALKSVIGDAIDDAEAWDNTSAQLSQILKVTGSSIPLSQLQAYAVQVQGLTLYTQEDVLQSEALIMSHQDLQGSYQSLVLLSADLATKTGSDLPNATRMLTNALEDPVAGINQLIRQGNIAFPAATVTMIEAMAKAGDTAGADKLIISELNGSIGGLAESVSGAPGAALTQLGNQFQSLGIVIGQDLLPLLDTMAKALMPVITDVMNWAAEHPKLTDAIVIGTIALAALLAIMGLVGVAVLTLTPAVAFLSATFGALAAFVALPALPAIALLALITLLAVIIKDNYTLLLNDAIAFKNTLESDLHAMLTFISEDWQNGWTGMGTFLHNLFLGIVNDLKTAINDVITIIDDLIAGMNALHINIPAITIPGTKVGTPAVNIGFDIPEIPHLAEGGIVSVPTVALIGESGPEAITPLSGSSAIAPSGGAGQGQIVINIQGGNYLDRQGADTIAQALATKIQHQLKLTSFR